MKRQFFKYIASLILLFTVHSSMAVESDSLKFLLDQKLKTGEFREEEEVMQYLSITSKLYLTSPADALYFANALEEKLNSQGIETGKAEILSKIAAFYWLQGIYDAALKSYFEALTLFEQEGNMLQVVKTLNNIGETYKKQDDYIQAARFLKLALSRAEMLEGHSPQMIFVNLGQLFMLQGNYDSANYYLHRISKKEDLSLQVKGFINLYKGIISREVGKIDSAQFFLKQSLSNWQETEYMRGVVESKIEMAKICIGQNKLPAASIYLNDAERLATEIKALDLLLRLYQSKIDLFQLKGSKDSLVFYFNQYIKIKDSVFNAEARAEINKLGIQYDLSEKEKESYKLALEQSQLTSKVEKRTQFLVFMIVLLLFAVVLILHLRNKSNQLKTAHIKLKNQKEEIEEKQKKISSKSLALARVNKELHSLNANLEERVVDRTKKLNERNRQIAEFTYYNSHKLRAPVANVLGLINVIELTKEGQIDPTVLQYLKTSALELDKVIMNLRNLLEIEEDEDNNE